MKFAPFFQHYKQAIGSLQSGRSLGKEDLLTDVFLMATEGQLEMFYAPHNECLNRSARIVIIGITPGWTQMKTAFQAARTALAEGLPDEEVCRRAKQAAGFAGSMRSHLQDMLDRLGLPEYLQISSSSALFGESRHLLHTISLLRYPVFAEKRNYTGAHPDIWSSPLLRQQALSVCEELKELREALMIPLGRAVERVLRRFAEQGRIREEHVLWGFPHPSGANGHRHRQFAENEVPMRRRLSVFFEGPEAGMT